MPTSLRSSGEVQLLKDRLLEAEDKGGYLVASLVSLELLALEWWSRD